MTQRVTIAEDEPVEFFGLVLNLGGRAPLTASEVAEVALTAKDITGRTPVEVLEKSLLPSEVLTAVVLNDAGYPYAGGYNFHYVLPSMYLSSGGRTFAVEFLLEMFEDDEGRPRLKRLRFEVQTEAARTG